MHRGEKEASMIRFLGLPIAGVKRDVLAWRGEE
jgi:hypothetical protein